MEYLKQQIKIYSTSLTYNAKYTNDTDRVKFIIDSYKLPYTLIDVVYQKEEWEKLKLKKRTFPIIYVYGRILGTYEDFQELEDVGHLESILKGGIKILFYLSGRFFEKVFILSDA
jgi:Glutaredoxin and related proteins